MLIVESYALAVALCVVTMLCWGSWANTQKLASKEWRFQLFYWDYSHRRAAAGAGPRLHPGQHRRRRPRLPRRPRPGARAATSASRSSAASSSTSSNILLVAAIDIAGHGGGLPGRHRPRARAGRRSRTTWRRRSATRVLLFAGVAGVVLAIMSRPPPTGGCRTRGSRTSGKGIVLSVVAGMLMGTFYRFVAAAMSSRLHGNLEAGKLGPYTASSSSPLGLLVSSFLLNTIVMCSRSSATPVPLGDYFTKGTPRLHLVGILGGMIWNLGMSLQHHRLGRRGVRDLVRSRPGRDDGRRVVGRVHLEGVPSAPAGTSRLLAPDVRVVRRRPRADRLRAGGVRLAMSEPIVVVGSLEHGLRRPGGRSSRARRDGAGQRRSRPSPAARARTRPAPPAGSAAACGWSAESGEDVFGEQLRASLAAAGVDTAQREHDTRNAFGRGADLRPGRWPEPDRGRLRRERTARTRRMSSGRSTASTVVFCCCSSNRRWRPSRPRPRSAAGAR